MWRNCNRFLGKTNLPKIKQAIITVAFSSRYRVFCSSFKAWFSELLRHTLLVHSIFISLTYVKDLLHSERPSYLKESYLRWENFHQRIFIREWENYQRIILPEIFLTVFHPNLAITLWVIVNEILCSFQNRLIHLIFVHVLVSCIRPPSSYLMNNRKDAQSFSEEEKTQSPSWSDSLAGFVNPLAFENSEIFPVS